MSQVSRRDLVLRSCIDWAQSSHHNTVALCSLLPRVVGVTPNGPSLRMMDFFISRFARRHPDKLFDCGEQGVRSGTDIVEAHDRQRRLYTRAMFSPYCCRGEQHNVRLRGGIVIEGTNTAQLNWVRWMVDMGFVHAIGQCVDVALEFRSSKSRKRPREGLDKVVGGLHASSVGGGERSLSMPHTRASAGWVDPSISIAAARVVTAGKLAAADPSPPSTVLGELIPPAKPCLHPSVVREALTDLPCDDRDAFLHKPLE